MTVPDGFAVTLVAAEPMIAQPVCLEFDDRGRLWVIQYLQYPNPAGLKRVKVDRYSRTVYDKVPDPPPRGPKGADRITILEDTNGDGRADTAKDFVNGLNLATGLAFGHGGVFVLQAPYLLFYPDRNGDDVPDSDPEVLLSGFGMEDAHALANSLTWGPDGWLYGCQGSTVTANIRGIEFQQGVWRYHPITRRFELFCEGGGNSWGLDFDADGELIYSTNFGPYRMLHGVQGGYYWKSFGKHGALHNPYTFGFFEHVPHRNFTGGHVTVGGIVYRGDSFPEKFRGKYIAGDLLGHTVQWHHLESSGSTFTSSHGGILLDPHDTWFAPSDVTVGPDGAVYVADWHDQRTAHPDPDAEGDRSNGRIYRIASVAADVRRLTIPSWVSGKVGERVSGKGRADGGPSDSPGHSLTHSRAPGETQSLLTSAATSAAWLAQLPSLDLVSLLTNRNAWLTRKARRLLADRRDPQVIAPLRKLVLESADDQLALEALWALYVSGGFDERFAAELLAHRSSPVRRWTVRFLSDEGSVFPQTARLLLKLAQIESAVRVRSQLASTAKRLPAQVGLPIARASLLRNLDEHDTHLPLLLWWAVEHHAVTAVDQCVKMFASPAGWQAPMIRDVILERLMRRYAAEGTDAALTACARFLASAPGESERRRMLAALDQGLQDRPAEGVPKNLGELFAAHAIADHKPAEQKGAALRIPPALETELAALWKDDTSNPLLIRVAARLRRFGAEDRALGLAIDPRAPTELRVSMLQLLATVGRPTCVAPILELLSHVEPEPVQLAALEAVQQFEHAEVPIALLRQYASMKARLRSRARDVLLSRKPWALALLGEVEHGRIPASEIPVEQLRRVPLFGGKQLDELIRKHWGNVTPGTPEEKLAEMRRLNNDLNAGRGDPARGRELFVKTCATCHRLFDEGGQVGPDLTHANRKDRDFLLASLVDPSAVIRKEFLSYNIETADGQFFSGLIAEQSPNSVTLVAANAERTTISRDKIKSLDESAVSLMPEGLLQSLRPQDLRDLFSYLQSDGQR